MKSIRSTFARGRAAALVALLLAALGVSIAPGAASAAYSVSLVRNQYVSVSNPINWQSCQHKNVTLPVLPTGLYYDWAQVFGGLDEGAWIKWDQTFHGPFYWTVCIQRISNPGYNYELWARLDHCNASGTSCVTHATRMYYFDLARSGNYDWGSQIWQAPPVG